MIDRAEALELLAVRVDEFIELSLGAMKGISGEIGL